MDELTRQSPAKINLALRVVARRPGGYHELESLVARIALCDTINVARRDDGQLTLACDEPGVPTDEQNLAMRAARVLADAAGVDEGVHIEIHKRIPAGAGLGGGSSNAATTLMLLNELWGLNLDRNQLTPLAAKVGSDVPLFLHGPLCIMRGRGEQIEDVAQALRAQALLFLPELHCATGAVYDAWDREARTFDRPPLGELVRLFQTPTELAAGLFNDLEEPACAAYPQLGAVARHLRERCPLPVHMTGSGAAFFCFADSGDADLQAIARAVIPACPVALRAVVTGTQTNRG